MNTQLLGTLAAEAMEEIEEKYGEEATLCTAALVLEIDLPDRTEILVTCTDNRAWIQLAFLKEGMHHVEDKIDQLLEERLADDDDD